MAIALAFFALVATRHVAREEADQVARIASRKHVRIAYWGDGYRFTYYNAAGRKVTSRKGVAASDVARLRKLAHAKGYSSIVF